MSKIDAKFDRPSAAGVLPILDQQLLDLEQGKRLGRARRTAAIVALVAVGFFVFSILQMLWVQHVGPTH
ncbi:MAG: hypothetical protein WA777_07905 [Rhodanobacter sp.]